MFDETNRCLPLLMSSDSKQLFKQEIEENNLMMVDSLMSRKRFAAELQRRYDALPRPFWLWYQELQENAQRAALLFVVLKTYRLAFDFHFNVTVKRWRAAERFISKDDIMMEFNEIAANDSFVDSWSDTTKNKCVSQYLTFLRHSGLMDEKTNELLPMHFEPNDASYYIRTGNEWFLEAALLFPYEINDLKSQQQ